MKKKLAVLLILLGTCMAPAVAVPQTAGAVNVLHACTGTATKSEVCKESKHPKNPAITVLRAALQLLSVAVGFMAVVMLIMGAMKLIWAQGDPAAIKSGRDGIIGALVGMVVATAAQATVTFILDKL